MKVGIIGHGYVGRAMERLFGAVYDVVVYDINTQSDYKTVEDADVHVICVPTPQTDNGHADVSVVERMVMMAGLAGIKLILIKSTVPPGTTDQLASTYSGDIAFSPEYVGEGKRYSAPWLYPDPQDSRSHGFTIIGSANPEPFLDLMVPVVANHCQLVSTSALAAELTKYMENSFLATKVIFCNEWARIAENYGISYHELRHLWTLDSRIGNSHTAVFNNKRGYGGKCLPKDMAAICAELRDRQLVVPLLEEVRATNARYQSANGKGTNDDYDHANCADSDTVVAPNLSIVAGR